jgi:hypothetical protein
MILCKDCKYKLNNTCLNEKNYPISPDDSILAIKAEDNFGCIHAERADGLTVCCQTCVHYTFPKNRWTDEQCNKDYFFINSEGETGYCRIDVDKMSCPEWVPREEKE